MDSAWSTVITSGHAQTYSSISTALANANSAMYSYLLSNYNYTVAQDYENGMYKPIIV